MDAITVDRYTKKHLKIGDSRYPMPVETNLFKGKIILSLRSNERLDHGSISQRGYFEGRNRISACFVQGKFKQKIAVKDVLTGQSFGTNLVNLPSKVFDSNAVQGIESDISKYGCRCRLSKTLLTDPADCCSTNGAYLQRWRHPTKSCMMCFQGIFRTMTWKTARYFCQATKRK